jgi:hypothetical protein
MDCISNPQGGQTNVNGSGADNSRNYDELMTRFGAQGQELGEYRTFFQNIAPLLDKLDKSPELVQAIVDGKLDQEIAKAVLEGRVDVRDAQAVQQAHEQVKNEMGDAAYNAAKPSDIQKAVEEQVAKFRKEFEEKAELQTFQEYTQKFIEGTPDFQQYADEIDKWLDTHDVTDIEVAYYAVKGQMSEKDAKKAAESAASDRAKDVIANASGGGQHQNYSSGTTSMADQLIAGRPNPNSFFN